MEKNGTEISGREIRVLYAVDGMIVCNAVLDTLHDIINLECVNWLSVSHLCLFHLY